MKPAAPGFRVHGRRQEPEAPTRGLARGLAGSRPLPNQALATAARVVLSGLDPWKPEAQAEGIGRAPRGRPPCGRDTPRLRSGPPSRRHADGRRAVCRRRALPSRISDAGSRPCRETHMGPGTSRKGREAPRWRFGFRGWQRVASLDARNGGHWDHGNRGSDRQRRVREAFAALRRTSTARRSGRCGDGWRPAGRRGSAAARRAAPRTGTASPSAGTPTATAPPPWRTGR